MPVRAEGAELVPADPWQIIHTARNFGPAEVGRDAMLDPQITAEVDGLAYDVAFYGCWLGRECQAILFRARLSKADWKPTARKIQAWNAGKLYGRAWVDGAGNAVLDHAVPMQGGLPAATLKAGFMAWRTALVEFAEHVDFK